MQVAIGDTVGVSMASAAVYAAGATTSLDYARVEGIVVDVKVGVGRTCAPCESQRNVSG